MKLVSIPALSFFSCTSLTLLYQSLIMIDFLRSLNCMIRIPLSASDTEIEDDQPLSLTQFNDEDDTEFGQVIMQHRLHEVLQRERNANGVGTHP